MKSNYFFYLAVALGLILAVTVGRLYQAGHKSTTKKIKSITANEFDRLLKQNNRFVLDVHVPEQTHIPGTDAFIPYDKINEHLDKLPRDKTTPLLVYCRSGSMSKQASQELLSLGYLNVYDLIGGINAYKKTHHLVAVDPQKKDLGTVIYGEIAKTSFTLTNFTNQPLTITRISTSCGCTKATTDQKNIPPYETTDILVSFNPAVHQDDTDLGAITRTIFIETDNKDYPLLEAKITAQVIKKS